jgi:hypothetical protein
MQETSLILRTNPLLTGNVKISISGDNLYLNSIESNDRLSSSTFKDVKINPNSHYAKDIYNFFEKGQTPTSLIFDAKNINNDKVVTDDFSKQYEHRYNYGVERCLEKSYDEQYKILAPLWLTRDIPKHFIIFKVPGAKHIEYERNPEEMVIGVNYKIIGDAIVVNNNIEYKNNVVAVANKYKIIGDGYVVMDDAAYEMSQVDIRKDFISKSQVVKVFNMQSGNIGTYLNNHINDPLFNENSIYTNFDEKTITYNGISINNGLFVNKITNISEQIKNEPTIINFDEYVTRGYERNRLLSANLLNFEFLFDDDENYKFNRYFGLYCNDTDLSTFYLDKHAMFNLLYPNQYMNKSNIPYNYSSEITDEDGVKIIMDEISSVGYTPDYDKIKNNNSFYYIKDKYNNILKINNDACDNNLVLSRKSINSDIISGFNTSVELDGEISQVYGKSLLEMTINNELYNGYTISIYYKNNRVGYVYADTLKNLDYEYNEGDSTFRFFHPLGTNEEIAGALAGALRWSLKEASYATIVVSHTDNRIIIRNTTTGSDNIPLKFVIHNDKNEITLSNNSMLGNSNTKFSRAKIDSEFVSILTDKSYILTDQGYSKIKEVILCIDDIKYTSDGKTITNPDELGRQSSIIISDPNQKISLKNGKISVYNESPIKLGILDIYNVGDLDFDFDSSSYSKSYNHEYDKYFDTDDDKLIIGETYFLFSKDDKTASISHNGTIKESNQTGIQRFVAITDNFESLTDNAVVINQKYYDDDELKIFIGFKTLQDASGGVVVDNMEDKISKLSTNINATEYDRLKENVISTNATKSKITPHINKWVLDGGKDIRDNDYRLNASLSFGKYNFSPSFIDDFQNPLYFTHEWLYLSNTPEAIDLLDLKYQTAYFSKKFEISKLKNVNEDYFTKYFTINSVFKNKGDKFEMIDVEPQKRFTDVKKITKNKFETFFRGVRINISSDTIDYTGYKFSSIMNLNKTKIFSRENPYKISIIENRDHKNITLVIDVTIDDYKILPNLDERIYGEYLFLYTMNSLKRWNHDDKVYELGLEMNLPDLDAINSVKIQKRLDGGGLETITKIRGTKIHNQARYKYTSGINHLEFNADKFPLGYFLKVVKDGSYGKVYGWNEDDAFMLTSDHSFTGQEFIIEKPATINDILGNIIDVKPPVSNGVGGISIGYIPFYSTVGNFAPLQINGFFSLALLYWFQEGGGSNYYDDLAKSLSFSTINNNIKENYNIDYKLCSDGELLDNNDMSLGMVEPTEISKLNDYDVEEENIISPELPEENIKDYVYKDKQIKEQIFRYSGYYSPKINSVLKFLDDNVDMVWGLYEKTWASVDKLWKNPLGGNFTSDKTPEELNEDRIPYSTILHDKNVKLDISNKNFGFIRNFYMHKIGSPNIISLSNPVYVNANEIAIDKTDIDIFSSQWDAQYHKLFTSKSTSNSVYGTKNMVDGKSFLGTKMLTLENNILVDNYDNISKGINISNVAYEMGNTDLVYESTPDRLSIRISYNNILRNYLKENIKDEFIKYVNYFNTNYKNDNDAINAYINDNLIASYMMDSIIFYVKTHNDENIEIINNEKNELLLLGNGYTLNKNFKSYEIVDGELLLTMATAKETKYSVNVKFSLKII